MASWASAAPFSVLTVPGAEETIVNGISDTGRVVGTYVDAELREHGFWYSGGHFETLGAGSDAERTPVLHPRAVNNTGQIVGDFTDAKQMRHGFIANSDAEIQAFDAPGALETRLSGINDRGDLVGSYLDAQKRVHGMAVFSGRFASLDVRDATETWPTGVTNRGEVAGFFIDGNGKTHGFYWISPPSDPEPTSVDFRNASNTWVTGVSNRGAVVGYYEGGDGHRRGFAWTSDERFDLVEAPVEDFLPVGMTRGGHLAGTYIDAFGRPNGFILFQRHPGGLWPALGP